MWTIEWKKSTASTVDSATVAEQSKCIGSGSCFHTQCAPCASLHINTCVLHAVSSARVICIFFFNLIIRLLLLFQFKLYYMVCATLDRDLLHYSLGYQVSASSPLLCANVKCLLKFNKLHTKHQYQSASHQMPESVHAILVSPYNVECKKNCKCL